VTVDGPGRAGEADGVVTSAPGVLVGVVTADCVPVLLRAPETSVVAAVHAGWRGAAAGVVEAGVEELCGVAGAATRTIEAAIGPAIGPCCYQVGPDVRAAFERRLGNAAGSVFTPDAGDRLRLDLRQAVRRLLEHAGVPAPAVVGPCTCCTPALHSYRRDGARAGRQLSFIGRI
jgi:YfiH family protein